MPSAYFRLILRGYGKTSREHNALIEGTGVSEGRLADATAEITLGQQLRQIRNANRLLEPGWALSVGTCLHAATHGAVGFAAVSAPTFRKSLEVMTRFSQLRSPHFRTRVSAQGNEIRVVMEERVELATEERTVLLDLVMLSAQGIAESVLGRPMKEARFEFSYPAPHNASRYSEYFHAPVRFDSREAAIVIPARWLEFESPLADQIMYEASLLRIQTGEPMLHGADALAARVEQLIAARGGRPGLEEVAHLMRISRRTLIRRLSRAGTSYSGLLAARQKGYTEALLLDRELSVAEVAYILGYEDPANFGRACRRWFGMSPGKYRGRLLGER